MLLIARSDDAIVVTVPGEREVRMMGQVMIALDRVTEYTKQKDGSWHADLRVPRLHVEGESPNDCRYRMMDQFDALLTQWLVAAQQSPRPRAFRIAETDTVPSDN